MAGLNRRLSHSHFAYTTWHIISMTLWPTELTRLARWDLPSCCSDQRKKARSLPPTSESSTTKPIQPFYLSYIDTCTRTTSILRHWYSTVIPEVLESVLNWQASSTVKSCGVAGARETYIGRRTMQGAVTTNLLAAISYAVWMPKIISYSCSQ